MIKRETVLRIEDEIRAARSNPAYMDAVHPQHQRIIERLGELYRERAALRRGVPSDPSAGPGRFSS